MSQEKITAISGAIFGIAAFIAGVPAVLPEDTPRLPFLIVTVVLASLSLILILISFFDLKHTLHNLYNLKKLGIILIHREGVSGNEAKRSNISKAKRIKLMAVSGEGFVKVFKKEIINSFHW